MHGPHEQETMENLVPGWDGLTAQEKFIHAFTITRSRSTASRLSGISQQRFSALMQKDSSFNDAFHVALDVNKYDLEDNNVKRAIDGWLKEERISPDGTVTRKYEFSAPLAIFMLKAWNPGGRYLFERDEQEVDELAATLRAAVTMADDSIGAPPAPEEATA